MKLAYNTRITEKELEMNLPPFTIQDFLKKEKSNDVNDRIDYSLAVNTIGGLAEELLETYIPVINSSTIESVSYNRINTIRVKFKNGGIIYEYFPVPESLWLQFLSSESKGQFHATKIKGNKEINTKKIK